MPNPYYNAVSGAPIAQSRGTSGPIRAEYLLIAAGFTSVTTDLATKGAIAGQAWTGTHDYTGATMTVAAPTVGSNPATKTYADSLSFASALPNQAGNNGKFITTNGAVASWNTTPLSPANGGTGISNNAASTLSIAGAFASTFTLTATTSVTFPTSGTLATLAGTEALTNKTINKITITTPATGSTLTLLDGKTFSVNNTMTLAGTDGQTYTFPATSAAIARTDAANTFAGAQTFSSTINKITLTQPATAATLTILDGKALIVDNSLELAGTDNTKMTFPSVSATIPGMTEFNKHEWSKVINGNFDIWQAGTSLGSGAGKQYLADQWQNDSVGSTYVPTQQVHTVGQVAVPNEPQFFKRTVATSVANAANYCLDSTYIENVRNYAGKTITLSFYAKADAGKNIAVEFVQNFGTGGAPSAAVTAIGVTTKTLTTGFVLQTVTVAIPSISGKTLGTTPFTSSLQINFWYDAGANFNARTNSLGQQSGTFDISQVWIEEGSQSTNFPLRPFGEELLLCQRYYEKSFDYAVAPAQNVGNLNGSLQYRVVTSGVFTNGSMLHFKVPMRTSPTMTFYNPQNTNGNWRNYTVADSAAPVVQGSSSNQVWVDNPQVGGDTAQQLMALHWSADARF